MGTLTNKNLANKVSVGMGTLTSKNLANSVNVNMGTLTNKNLANKVSVGMGTLTNKNLANTATVSAPVAASNIFQKVVLTYGQEDFDALAGPSGGLTLVKNHFAADQLFTSTDENGFNCAGTAAQECVLTLDVVPVQGEWGIQSAAAKVELKMTFSHTGSLTSAVVGDASSGSLGELTKTDTV